MSDLSYYVIRLLLLLLLLFIWYDFKLVVAIIAVKMSSTEGLKFFLQLWLLLLL